MEYCCETMKFYITKQACESHEKESSCSDSIVVYEKIFDEYGIMIHDGGSSYVTINYCPWCGTKLPKSKRDEWSEKLEGLGYLDPFEDNIPIEFISDAWWNK